MAFPEQDQELEFSDPNSQFLQNVTLQDDEVNQTKDNFIFQDDDLTNQKNENKMNESETENLENYLPTETEGTCGLSSSPGLKIVRKLNDRKLPFNNLFCFFTIVVKFPVFTRVVQN